MIHPLVVGAALAAAATWRVTYPARLEAELRRRLPLGPDGIVAGGGAIQLDGNGDRGVLLVHGAGDTPQTLGYLAAHLHQRGYAVLAPLLPGHGRRLRDFATVTSDDLLESVAAAHGRLATRHRHVAIVGLSMGGALAAALSARLRSSAPLVLLAPYLEMPGRLMRLAATAPLWGLLLPYVRSRDPRSIRDPDEVRRNLGYGVMPARALVTLARTARRGRAALPRIVAPTLVVQSRDDNRITAESCERSFRAIGSAEKELVLVEGAGHVITVDYGRQAVFDRVGEWIDRWLPDEKAGGA